jgi:membrane-associated HD superfamily phosphohydrolase
MTYPRFFQLLTIITLLAIACAAAAHHWLAIGYALPFTMGIIVMFLLFAVTLFLLGKRTAGAKNKMLFTSVFMGVSMFKMFLSGGVIAAYAILGEPTSKLFVVPFFTSYLLYTVLEVLSLSKLAAVTYKEVEADDRQPA